ncbi:MAG TPA: penicillin-binding transpeptidase domain-containing protein [Gemmatimonadaceae bacterium]|nr:penicillin-binding transpeptidase domain-containing protein [Gemmatimonadaceae bacterium]
MIRVSRVGAVHAAFVVFAIALVGRSAWVQLGQTERWRTLARGQQATSTEIPAARGAIVDAAGNVLVESRSLVRLDIAPTEIRKVEPLRAALAREGVSAEFIRRATDRKRKWVELPGRFLTTEVADLMAMRGVHARPVLERVPPPTDGLRRLLGTTDNDGRAIGGVEAALDDVLRGTPGRTVLVKDGKGRRFASPEEKIVPATAGHTVALTLHQGLQDIAERALADAISGMEATGGDIVVLDPHTGEVRALASRRARADASGATALTEPFEPGSTLKPFVAAALLEKGRVRLDESIDTHNGTFKMVGRTINDVHRAPRMTFAEVIQFSSNIGMAQVSDRLTPGELFEALRDAGFGMTTGLPYPSESSGRLRAPGDWSRLSPASLSMGYEISVTPMQLASAYAAIANGGELLQPQLVKEVRTSDGEVTFRAQRRVVRRIMTEQTARTVRGLLRDVVASGTGSSADLSTFQVAGKSGTARRTGSDGRGYEQGHYTASFVGLFPAEAPQIVILVKLDNPAGAYYGGRTAAPVTKAVLEAAIAARDAALDRKQLSVVPQRIATSQAVVPDSVHAADTAAREAAASSTPFVFELGVELPEPRRVVTARAVPNVHGLQTRSAVRALHRAGFRVTIAPSAGRTSTVSNGQVDLATSPAAGTMLPAGSVVRLGTQR